jgi:hypothetical protein
MTGSNDSSEVFEARMAEIRKAGPAPIVAKFKRQATSRRPQKPIPRNDKPPTKPVPSHGDSTKAALIPETILSSLI